MQRNLRTGWAIVLLGVCALGSEAWAGINDTSPPVITVHYPIDGMAGVSPLVRLEVTITDDGCVPLDSIVVTLNGEDVSADLVISGGCGSRAVQYRASPRRGLAEDVHVVIQAVDAANNFANAELAFTITDGVDRNLDNLPDDWAAEHGIVDGGADPDGDGLNNRYEAQFGGNPFVSNAPFGDEDPYEPDDSAQTAAWIGTNGLIQARNFHEAGDVDWAAFYAEINEPITILTQNQGSASNTKIEIIDTDGETVLDEDTNSGFEPGDAFLLFRAPDSGVFYVRVSNEGTPGANAYYELHVLQEIGPTAPAAIDGLVYDKATNQGIREASVSLGYISRPITASDWRGMFLINNLGGGSYTVIVDHPDYVPDSRTVFLSGQDAYIEIGLDARVVEFHPMDVNRDGKLDAVDLQLTILGALGLDTMGYDVDVNGDGELDALDVQTVILAILSQ